jgi:PAS domain S-box-containing protein
MSVYASVIKRMETGIQPLALATTVLILASLTYSIWNFARSRVDAEARVRFDDRAIQVLEEVRGRMIDYEQVLRGCAGLFAASNAVTRNEWAAYVETLRVNRNYPGIQGIGYAQHVLKPGKAEHEAWVRAQGFPEYAIHPPGDRAEYVPTVYLEPFSGRNLRAFGFDMLTTPARRIAMVRARDTADIAITNKLALIQDEELDTQSGFIMYLPVYAKAADLSRLDNRRAMLAGYVYSPFRADDLMHGILGDMDDIRVQIYDGAVIDEKSLLFDSGKAHAEDNEPLFAAGDGILIHGHSWTFRITSKPQFEASIDYTEPLTVLASGAVISLLLLAIIGSLGTLRFRAVTLAHRMTNELRESREQLSLALEGSELAFFDWNVSTGDIELSSRWAEMLGGPSGPTSTTIDELSALVHPDDTPRLQRMLRAALRGETAFYEVEHRVKDRRGDWIWILSRAKITARDAAGLALRVTGTNANISQRKQIERMKEEFISTVNHELRTPLTVIVGTLALLKESLTGLPPDQAMMLEMATQNSARLKLLVNDILDLEKIVLGAMQFRIEPVPLAPFLKQALDLNRLYADRFKVRYELHGTLPAAALSADRERLLQVMTNLLSNAAKFSPEGDDIAVTARIEDGMLRVSVTDHGPGVPLEFRGRIFGKFAQADGSNTRRQEGTGLGLAICKSIIEKMNGRIGFESEPGKGATFYFDLPYIKDTAAG